MRKSAIALVTLIALGGAGYWWLTRPAPLPDQAFAGLAGEARAGEAIFWAAGCASCHATDDASGDARLLLAGGQRFESPFGTFVAPNISPDPEHGIGGWTLAEFGNAMLRGVSPDGRHYYPAFPYTAYICADPQDVADLWAFLQTLPASNTPDAPHELPFPFSIRRNLGLWKALYLDDGWVLEGALSDEVQRGRYLVEALGHCAECHTPRDRLGGLDTDRWMQGAPNPSGEGRIPPITPGELGWTQQDIAGYLASGFTPDFDVAGGAMAPVVESLAQLPRSELDAIAAYLLALED
ncbi:cytochrome c [Alkalilacustris brevis]|uniref:cytochrome c n=1 Tax=Alkalilacustris brevis TaxID=2026338 RepID=UPI000E0D296B|nr:cytochrome c [Alkalilacustris brevis]